MSVCTFLGGSVGWSNSLRALSWCLSLRERSFLWSIRLWQCTSPSSADAINSSSRSRNFYNPLTKWMTPEFVAGIAQGLVVAALIAPTRVQFYSKGIGLEIGCWTAGQQAQLGDNLEWILTGSSTWKSCSAIHSSRHFGAVL